MTRAGKKDKSGFAKIYKKNYVTLHIGHNINKKKQFIDKNNIQI